MKHSPEDLATIHDFVYPALTGAKRLVDFPASSIHMGYSETAVFQALLSTLKPKCQLPLAPA